MYVFEGDNMIELANKKPGGRTSSDVKWTTLSTYHVRGRGKKRLNVGYHGMASINTGENQSSICRHISGPREDMGPLGPLVVKWQSQCASRAKGILYGFQMKIGPVVSKICPILWTRVTIFYKLLKYSSNELKNHVNPLETFCKIAENPPFELSWSYSGANILHTSKSSSSEL